MTERLTQVVAVGGAAGNLDEGDAVSGTATGCGELCLDYYAGTTFTVRAPAYAVASS